MKKEWIVIGAIIGVALIIVGSFALIPNKPEPANVDVEVTSVELEWTGIVTVTIFNHGDSGTITVWVELKQDDTWKKAKTVSIDSKESMELSFVFKSYNPYLEAETKAWVSY